jgi:hypothetical protein
LAVVAETEELTLLEDREDREEEDQLLDLEQRIKDTQDFLVHKVVAVEQELQLRIMWVELV